MVRYFLLTDQICTIISLFEQLIHPARFILGVIRFHRQAGAHKNQRFMAIWEAILQNAPESAWARVTQKSCEPPELFIGADFMLGFRNLK